MIPHGIGKIQEVLAIFFWIVGENKRIDMRIDKLPPS